MTYIVNIILKTQLSLQLHIRYPHTYCCYWRKTWQQNGEIRFPIYFYNVACHRRCHDKRKWSLGCKTSWHICWQYGVTYSSGLEAGIVHFQYIDHGYVFCLTIFTISNRQSVVELPRFCRNIVRLSFRVSLEMTQKCRPCVQ